MNLIFLCINKIDVLCLIFYRFFLNQFCNLCFGEIFSQLSKNCTVPVGSTVDLSLNRFDIITRWL
ncbi:hypothetical protein LINPERHAP1_LOCUS43855, partial [Linum perenne]